MNNKKITANNKKYTDRSHIYAKYGYDIKKEREFILNKARPLAGRMLEVGTGKGHFTLELAKEGHRFISIDISKQEQDFAKLNLRYFKLDKFVKFEIADAENLRFKSNSFDIIFSINTIHHFSQTFNVLNELERILSPKGKIVLSDFNKKGLDIVAKVHENEGRKHDVSPITLKEIDLYFKHKNFNAKKYSSIFQDILIINRLKI